MAVKFVLWDDQTKQLGSASAFGRDKVKNFFASPFWPNIPDAPFKTLGDEFSVDTQGALHIASIDLSKVQVSNLPDWTDKV